MEGGIREAGMWVGREVGRQALRETGRQAGRHEGREAGRDTLFTVSAHIILIAPELTPAPNKCCSF